MLNSITCNTSLGIQSCLLRLDPPGTYIAVSNTSPADKVLGSLANIRNQGYRDTCMSTIQTELQRIRPSKRGAVRSPVAGPTDQSIRDPNSNQGPSH